jgi:PucR family transcriptional regulator, purine catabolism regulatory protein
MPKVANRRAGISADLPPRRDEGSPGLPLAEVLRLPCLEGARVLAGHRGLDRPVSRLNVMEVPDVEPWVRAGELLLTTGYPLRGVPEGLAALVTALAERGVAGIAVKAGRYLEQVPADMLAEADRVGMPVVGLPEDLGFDDVINQVLTAVLNRQAALLERADRLHAALLEVVLTGGGLDRICEEVLTLVDGAVLVTTPDGRVVASAGEPERVAGFRDRGLFDPTDRFRVEQHAVGVSADGTLGMVRIVAGSLDHGRVVALSVEETLTEEDLHLLERAATVAALAITKDQAVAAVESKYRTDFLRDVLSGRAGGPEQVIAHAHSLGWDMERPLVVVVAGTDPGTTPPGTTREELHSLQDRFAAAWSRTVQLRDPQAPVVGFSQEVVVVLGADAEGEPQTLMRSVRDMVRSVSGDGGGGRRSFSTGVSRVVGSVADLPEAYSQALKAVTVGRQMHGPSALTHFDGLGVFRLLSLVPDTAELHAFVTEALGDLVRHDTPENADLRQTLSVLLDTNLNVAQTARQLHFHYNTLRHRIVKLERLLGPFTTDPRLRLKLALALQVVQMKGI